MTIQTNPDSPVIRPSPPPPSRIVLDLPLPPKELQPNKRLGRHWGPLNRYRVQAQHDAFCCFYSVVGPDPPPWRRVAATAVITVRDGRQVLDGDNAEGWLKATQDQLAVSLGINDRQWRWERIRFVVDKRGTPGLQIEIWEASDG